MNFENQKNNQNIKNIKKNPKNFMQTLLLKLGLKRDFDFILHFPMRYEDETKITQIADTEDGDLVQIEATILASEIHESRGILKVYVEDNSDSAELVFFKFSPNLAKMFYQSQGKKMRFYGKITENYYGNYLNPTKQIIHPTIKNINEKLSNHLTPIYPSTEKLSQNYLRKVIFSKLDKINLPETLPYFPSDLKDLPSLKDCINFLHRPPPDVNLEFLQNPRNLAWQRIKAEELLAQQISQFQYKNDRSQLLSQPLKKNLIILELFKKSLPFKLTKSQQKVIEEILEDLTKNIPMNRLLQGDVGSGKTVVAMISALSCVFSGFQCVLMAPTEILAIQHLNKFKSWREEFLKEIKGKNKKIAYLSGSQKVKEKRENLEIIQNGEAGIIIGTHAIIQENVNFSNLALVIIDEQQRFGVEQRLALRQKMKNNKNSENSEPHLLMMSATPIPRTLAMSFYTDLEVSTINEMPAGRTPVETKIISIKKREEVINRLKIPLAENQQIYWVCPLIEESEKIDLSNAKETQKEIEKTLKIQVGLVHSKMKTKEKEAIMENFVAGNLKILVSTTVIEVGVDVANASVMIIDHAERFGLSQLHQLRGRVGRGTNKSFCLLLYGEKITQIGKERLKIMSKTNDGFLIAKKDLELRGMGEFFGSAQSGNSMLRFTNLITDEHLLNWAVELAPKMLNDFPDLAKIHLERWLGGSFEFLKA